MEIYKQTVPAFGSTYSYELPDGWTTGREDDGERWFSVHRSPENSPLWIKVSITTGCSTRWKPNGMPKELAHPDLHLAFAQADMDACMNTGSFLMQLVRYLAYGFGWHARLKDETLGKCRGFTHSRGPQGEPGWFGCFVQSTCLLWVDFKPAGKDHAAEIAVVRRIVASFKVESIGAGTAKGVIET